MTPRTPRAIATPRLTLREKQERFTALLPSLLVHAFGLGFTVTLGETYRSPEEATRLATLGTGITNSLHTQRLAIDLNLFREGRYLSSTESHRALGEWWEQQSTEAITCCWGGRFGDGNHYSVGHEGRR